MMDRALLFTFAATLTLILSCIFCAAIRWFHVCRTYRHNPSYYYPARGWLTFLFLTIVLEFPFLLAPDSESAFLLVCNELMSIYPIAAASTCYIYFVNDKKLIKRCKTFSYLIISLQTLFSLWTLFNLYGVSGATLSYIKDFIWLQCIGIDIVLCLFIRRLYKKLKKSFYDKYSNEEDFPLTVIKVSLASLALIVLLTSLPLLTHSLMVLSFAQIIFAVWNVFFLISILDSKRIGINDPNIKQAFKLYDPDQESAPSNQQGTRFIVDAEAQVEQEECEDEEDIATDAPDGEQPTTSQELLLQQIEELMEREQLYLSPHFSMVELCKLANSNRTYVNQAIRLKYNSFYDMTNRYRIQYADQYIIDNPDAKKEEIAIVSGFGSYKSYWRARQQPIAPQ